MKMPNALKNYWSNGVMGEWSYGMMRLKELRDR
jgi:hypothetical protein